MDWQLSLKIQRSTSCNDSTSNHKNRRTRKHIFLSTIWWLLMQIKSIFGMVWMQSKKWIWNGINFGFQRGLIYRRWKDVARVTHPKFNMFYERMQPLGHSLAAQNAPRTPIAGILSLIARETITQVAVLCGQNLIFIFNFWTTFIFLIHLKLILRFQIYNDHLLND